MPTFRVTITRVYEADFEAQDHNDAKETALEMPVSSFLIVGTTLEVEELITEISARKSA